ncbi:Structural maintenance of chromosomes protein 5 [Thelohanellus kitauei]|uniref:Structural maintenance of chromosomes protein 5 n=1 Tax=Thelohanellus kitauei TaxID=669202 RepID=A0A0C2MVU9_THEKT|nr:Structural maintenance of chromosomes protein 5 [Thelohanellus kitauei]
MVSYRTDENPTRLNPHRHSGGEKAVAIMLFLMAIQQMSQSPFKMIDEINQGMDSHNEKIISNIMMDTVASLNSTNQYFYLSPKVLPDLTYSENVTIHIIFNGEIHVKQIQT